MARRRGIFRRNSDSKGGERAESPPPPPAEGASETSPEEAADPRRPGRSMAWLGYGPESEPNPGASGEPGPEAMPATQEWRVAEAEPHSDDPPAELPTEVSMSNPWLLGDEPREKADDPPPADAGSAGPPAEPSARRGDTA